MKHAGTAALDAQEDLLNAVRARDGLREPRRGVLVEMQPRPASAVEYAAGLFADLRVGTDWQRFPVTTATARAALLGMIDRSL